MRIAERRELLRHLGHLFCPRVLVHTVLVSGHESHRVSSTSCALNIFFPFRRTAVAVTLSWCLPDFGEITWPQILKAIQSNNSRRKLKTYPKHQNILRDQQFLPLEYRALHLSTRRYTPHDFTPATIMSFHLRHSAVYTSSWSSLSLKNLKE